MQTVDRDSLEVAEGIHSTFSYHLRKPGAKDSLCGKWVMHTRIPVSAWGTKTHLHERWCSKCAAMKDGARHADR